METKRKLSGSQIVIETLIEQGVTDIFGYPGSQVLDIYDALFKAKGRIRHVLMAHEQGAAHAADGYARTTGKVGVVLATSGPGATNLVTGIATAMLDSVPMVAITGNVATNLIGKDSFQEINITGVTMPITKHNYFVSDVKDLARVIREAFTIAKSGRPGPVLIDIPKDVQLAEAEFIKDSVVQPYQQEQVEERGIHQAVKLINKAKRPYIYIGGGAARLGMTDAIMAMADKIDAYVGCSLMGLSVLPDSYERFLGMQGMHGRYASSMASKEADLIIGLGVRFSDRATGNTEKFSKAAKVIQLDADLAEIGKNVFVDVGLVGDVASAFTRLFEACNSQSHPAWHKKIEGFKAEGKRICEEAEKNALSSITPKQLFDVINQVKDEKTIIVTDVGQHQMWTAQHVAFQRPRRFASSGGLGTMGYGLGAAIGAYVGNGDKTILITGDGSFGMNLNELATAVTYNIPVVIVLINNGVLGMVRQWQTFFYEGRHAETVLHRQTDFVKLSQAFGAEGARVETIKEFETAFKKAIKYNGPYLIDVQIDKEQLVLPMLPPGGTLEDMITFQEQEES